MQLQPICAKLEKLHETFLSREEMLSRLDASASDVAASLSQLKIIEEENRQLLSENAQLQNQVESVFQPTISLRVPEVKSRKDKLPARKSTELPESNKLFLVAGSFDNAEMVSQVCISLQAGARIREGGSEATESTG